MRRKVGDVRTEGRADGLTKAQADRALWRMRELGSPLAAPDAGRVTMEQAGREFGQRLERKGRRKSHRLTVASDLRNRIAPFCAGKTLDRIRPADIERYASAKRGTVAVKTIRDHVNKMHSIFDLGLRKGWCQTNPSRLTVRPPLQAGARPRRRSPDHGPRAAPHARNALGDSRHADAHAAALDGHADSKTTQIYAH